MLQACFAGGAEWAMRGPKSRANVAESGMSGGNKGGTLGDETRATHAGNHPRENHGVINPPIYRASTILYPDVATLEQVHKDRLSRISYGRFGTPTVSALEEAVTALEGGGRAIVVSSGLAAISATLLQLLKTGDHLLIVDTVYGPVRGFCDKVLSRFGVDVSYYDPAIAGDIARLIKPQTRIVYVEAPGSLTFEMQDIPAIASAARAAGALVMMDNTWATPLYFKPFRHDVDIIFHAATKYIVGHSDVMMGIVVCRDELYRQLKLGIHALGHSASPDDCYLALRGLRTLPVRVARNGENALALARWLQQRPEVARVLHPALPGDPGHDIWKRDFTGSSGLFGIVLHPCPPAGLAAMLDGMRLFGMGASWGGYESLILPVNPAASRTAVKWDAAGPTLRLHAGLELVSDLIADLEDGFSRLAVAAG
jgi:cystathionine beta-lyase